MGAYGMRSGERGRWVDAYWGSEEEPSTRVVDVTGAGNAFLGGLSAGLILSGGDLYQAMYYASVSASFIVEQHGLPTLSSPGLEGEDETWNGDQPRRRLSNLLDRHQHEAGQTM